MKMLSCWRANTTDPDRLKTSAFTPISFLFGDHSLSVEFTDIIKGVGAPTWALYKKYLLLKYLFGAFKKQHPVKR